MLIKLTDFRSIGLLVYDMYKTITSHICPNINGLGAEIYFAGIAAVLVDRIALVQSIAVATVIRGIGGGGVDICL